MQFLLLNLRRRFCFDLPSFVFLDFSLFPARTALVPVPSAPTPPRRPPTPHPPCRCRPHTHLLPSFVPRRCLLPQLFLVLALPPSPHLATQVRRAAPCLRPSSSRSGSRSGRADVSFSLSPGVLLFASSAWLRRSEGGCVRRSRFLALWRARHMALTFNLAFAALVIDRRPPPPFSGG